MTINKHLQNFIFTARSSTSTRITQRFAGALVVFMAVLLPPRLAATELSEPTSQSSGEQVIGHIPPLQWVERTVEPTLPKRQQGERFLKMKEEAKIQAQTEYLAAKFRQRESTVRTYVELAWQEASKRDGMAPELLIAMMQKESSLRPKVQSSYGAQGLMQVVRRWHHDKLHPSESLFDPAVNIRVGADVLEEYLEKANGSLSKALRIYSGNARGYAKTVLNESYKLARVAAEAASYHTAAVVP